ncbi:hypothetical protein [Accumulibacter sp.]|uniref:hypothetical protein n=1 Tax=Accumulibacter sp. TaxID=2053492 RepID=UPI001AC2698C|nr:hypothetical protein [Accumulibacter sp.]MBN8453339.1 hypothetical protein [Accumulibacter sp.]MBO3706721.1 hypothetical protein [Candidatus Accumulibacter conexus]
MALNTNSLRSSGGASVLVTGVANGRSALFKPIGAAGACRALSSGGTSATTLRSSAVRGVAAGRVPIFLSGCFLKNEKTMAGKKRLIQWR